MNNRPGIPGPGRPGALAGLIALGLAACPGCEPPAPIPARTYLFGARVPRGYFLVTGRAERDDGRAEALQADARAAAGLGEVNLTPGISALGAVASEVKRPKALPPGAVLDAAVAEATGPAGSPVTAGLLLARVRDTRNGKVLGGFVVTYQGSAPPRAATATLRADALARFRKRFQETVFELLEDKILLESFTPRRGTGMAFVAAVFSDELYRHHRPDREFMSLRDFTNQ